MSTLISQRLRSRPDQEWPGHRLLVHEPLRLDCGVDFGPFTIAYQTYGKLDPDRTNAILVCHALTGDQYVADPQPITDKPGRGATMVGRGLVLRTDRYCRSCSRVPGRGLAVARMAAHITYLSEPALHRKFGRNLQDRHAVTYGFDADFQVESYLRHQGSTFVDRFDANSYLYITRAMDYFDLADEHGGSLANAFKGTPSRFCIISFTSDWLFPTSESRQLVHALNAVAANVSFVEIETDKGHDAFLLHEPELFGTLRGFLTGCAEHRGLTRSW